MVLALVQSFGIALGLQNTSGVVSEPGPFFIISTVATLTGGTLFLMWMGEQITARGVGNGTSLIIFAGIVARLPQGIWRGLTLAHTGQISPLLLVGVPVIPPLKVNTAGVIPPIFASSLLLLPTTVLGFLNNANLPPWIKSWLPGFVAQLTHGQPLFIVFYATLIIFFSFFYTSIQFNPEETAENLRKHGGFIPGVRPGKNTATYIDHVLTRLTVLGAAYITAVCIMPELLTGGGAGQSFYVGGTSILIVITVTMDTVAQIQSHLLAHQYEGLIRKAKLRSGGRSGAPALRGAR